MRKFRRSPRTLIAAEAATLLFRLFFLGWCVSEATTPNDMGGFVLWFALAVFWTFAVIYTIPDVMTAIKKNRQIS